MIQMRKLEHVLVDLNTQNSLLPGGCCSINDHRRVLLHIHRMMAWVRHNNVKVISVCIFYPYNGDQRKIRCSLLNDRKGFVAECRTDLPVDLFQRYRQVIMQSRSTDPFKEPRIERLLSEVRADNFIIIGASTERAVKATALGLLQRGRRVTVVKDAVGLHHKREAKLALNIIKEKGARLIETKELAGISHLRHVDICGCAVCKVEQAKIDAMQAVLA